MSYCIETDKGLEELSGQSFQIGDIQYPENIIYLWSEQALLDLGLLPIQEPADPPIGQVVLMTSLHVVEGQAIRSAEYGSPPVPAKVHKYWLTKVLEALGEIDSIEDALDEMAAAGNRAPRRDWQNATEIERSNQLLCEFALSRDYTVAQVDQMFIQAALYQEQSQQG